MLRLSRRTPYLGLLRAERATHEPRGIVLILIRTQTRSDRAPSMSRGFTWTTRSEGENPRVVGRLTMGILERVYGLDRPYRPHLRRLGAVPVLQCCEKRKLV